MSKDKRKDTKACVFCEIAPTIWDWDAFEFYTAVRLFLHLGDFSSTAKSVCTPTCIKLPSVGAGFFRMLCVMVYWRGDCPVPDSKKPVDTRTHTHTQTLLAWLNGPNMTAPKIVDVLCVCLPLHLRLSIPNCFESVCEQAEQFSGQAFYFILFSVFWSAFGLVVEQHWTFQIPDV